MNLFKQLEVRLIEIPVGTKLPEMNEDLRESIKSLQYHPGFQYILNRQRLQRAQVNHALTQSTDINTVRYAQAGLHWLKFLENEYNHLTKTPAPTRKAEPTELEAFNEISQNLELIGSD